MWGPPHLAAVLVGEDGASQNYVAFKIRDCEEVGFGSTTIRMKSYTTEQELLEKISELNANIDIDGFIVQLPLPSHIDENKVILAIDPKKDVDGFCPENVGNLNLGLPIGSPKLRLPTFSGQNPSTSFFGSMARITLFSSICDGNGN